MSHPFLLLRGDCSPACKTEFDADCSGLDCDDNCIDDLRTVIACDACTCQDILNLPNCSGGAGSFGSTAAFSDDFDHCLCLDADNHRSIAGTKLVTSVTVFWHLPRTYDIGCSPSPDKLTETITQTIIDAGTCPEDAHSRWRLYKAPHGTIVPDCPSNADPDVWSLVPIDGEDFLVDADEGGDIITLDFPIESADDPVFEGEKLCTNRPIPVAFLLVVSDACENVMTSCPITVPGDVIVCPVCELLCCAASFSRAGGTNTVTLCEDGSLSVHVVVIVSCEEGVCTCATGSGSVTFQYPIGTAIAQSFSGGTGTYTFDQTLSCAEDDGPEVLIIVTFTCETPCVLPNCPDTASCPDTTGEMIYIALGGSL